MELYTVQLAQWRKCKALDIPILDVTSKSGDQVFAPGMDIVMDVKQGAITEAEYTDKYLGRMRTSYKENSARWDEVLKSGTVAIACYCNKGRFCHRHLLVDIFRKLCLHKGLTFTYKGEIG